MQEIGTSSLMSGDGKRGVGRLALSCRAHLRPYPTAISRTCSNSFRYLGMNRLVDFVHEIGVHDPFVASHLRRLRFFIRIVYMLALSVP
jgi:hypothetical protein